MPYLRNAGFFFRFHTLIIDGHDVKSVCNALEEASKYTDGPTAILAKTFKGKGVKGNKHNLM